MKLRYVTGLSGVSIIALSTSLMAQEAQISQTPGVTVLVPITLVADGQESVEATGGVIVTLDDIDKMAPADVSELFSQDSAITVSGGAGPSKRIYVLGMEQSNLAVSVDGVPQFGSSWHHTGSNVIDPAFLKTVDVEAGAAAADSGFGAAAGAVRYETVGARDLLTDGRTQGGRAGLSYGTNGRGASVNLAGYGIYEDFDWFVMVHTAEGDNYENGEGYELPGSEPSTRGALAKLGYEFEGHRVELAYEHSRDEADRVIKMNMDLGHTDEVHPLKVSRNTLSLKYSEVSPTENWDPEAMIYVSRNEYWRPNYATGDRPINGDMDLEAQTIGGVLKNRFAFGPGTITAGVDFAYDDYRIDNYGDIQPGVRTLETMQVGTFVQGRFEFDNGIDLSTGLRLDHHRFTDWNGRRLTDSGASANGTISYEFAPGYEVFAGASHTWLGFDFGEVGLLHARDADFATDPDLEPAEARNIKIGFNATQAAWTGNLTFFDTRLKGLGEYDVGAGFLTNAEEYRSRGFTLQGNYSWGTGKIGASFTKAKLTNDGEEALPQGGTVMPIGEVASIYLDQELPQYNLTVGGSIELAGRLSGDYLTEAGFEDHSGYGVVNAYAQWRPENYDNLVVQLNVDNLFDKTYYERSSYVQYSPRDVYPLYAPGRTVTLGLKLDF